MRLGHVLGTVVLIAAGGCANSPALKQPSDPFTVVNPDLVAATAIAVYQCQRRGYDTARMEGHSGPTVTFVCTGVYPSDLQKPT
jgi:hypothetical protein